MYRLLYFVCCLYFELVGGSGGVYRQLYYKKTCPSFANIVGMEVVTAGDVFGGCVSGCDTKDVCHSFTVFYSQGVDMPALCYYLKSCTNPQEMHVSSGDYANYSTWTIGLTRGPSNAPTVSPTPVPSVAPSKGPSDAPSEAPTMFPSEAPSVSPTPVPSVSPSTSFPTSSPTTSAPTPPPTNKFWKLYAQKTCPHVKHRIGTFSWADLSAGDDHTSVYEQCLFMCDGIASTVGGGGTEVGNSECSTFTVFDGDADHPWVCWLLRSCDDAQELHGSFGNYSSYATWTKSLTIGPSVSPTTGPTLSPTTGFPTGYPTVLPSISPSASPTKDEFWRAGDGSGCDVGGRIEEYSNKHSYRDCVSACHGNVECISFSVLEAGGKSPVCILYSACAVVECVDCITYSRSETRNPSVAPTIFPRTEFSEKMSTEEGIGIGAGVGVAAVVVGGFAVKKLRKVLAPAKDLLSI